jgi:uncharacterized protein YjbI with pentapeptide repeats
MRTFTEQELEKILDNHKLWLSSNEEKGERANLRYANLRYADLRDADLRYADLSNANLDFSAFPLWCGGLDVNIDDKIATQLLYHLVRNVQFSKNTSDEMKAIFRLKTVVEQANKFHRVEECGKIEEE